ncbi:MAG: DNA-processing protein DprA [Acidimicrobiales bacterium]
MTEGTLTEDQRFAAALAALGMSPARLRRLLHNLPPRVAWDALATGTHPADPEGRSRQFMRHDMVEEVATRCTEAGVNVRVLGESGYPPCLADDPEAPAVVFVRGELALLEDRPRAALVGTRSATSYGREVAFDLGRALAEAGVVVVSGLARGIDTAAHAGALDVDHGGPPAGVLGTAHDALGTPAQLALCDRIGRLGAVLSEVAPGTEAARWRFAVRNRVMAALAHVVVVVECHVRGGALHTVAAAKRRGIAVAAVPGSVRSSASAGANALLAAGERCVRHPGVVLDLLSEATTSMPGAPAEMRPKAHPKVSGPGLSSAVLDLVTSRVRQALEADPASLDTIVRRSGRSIGEVALALERLSRLGLASGDRGWWSQGHRRSVER